MRVLKCNPGLDAATMEAIEAAAEDIRAGELVVYPTETVYGIGADIYNQKAIKNLFVAKNRPFDMPLSVAVADKDMVEQIAVMTRPVEKLIDAFLPGPLTIITKKNPNVPDIVTSTSFKVGIRIPDDPVALELVKRTGPIVATSANLHSPPRCGDGGGGRRRFRRFRQDLPGPRIHAFRQAVHDSLDNG